MLLREKTELKQRSKVNWLKEGDNTIFFSIATIQRKAKNSTFKILNKEGNQNMTRT